MTVTASGRRMLTHAALRQVSHVLHPPPGNTWSGRFPSCAGAPRSMIADHADRTAAHTFGLGRDHERRQCDRCIDRRIEEGIEMIVGEMPVAQCVDSTLPSIVAAEDEKVGDVGEPFLGPAARLPAALPIRDFKGGASMMMMSRCWRSLLVGARSARAHSRRKVGSGNGIGPEFSYRAARCQLTEGEASPPNSTSAASGPKRSTSGVLELDISKVSRGAGR